MRIFLFVKSQGSFFSIPLNGVSFSLSQIQSLFGLKHYIHCKKVNMKVNKDILNLIPVNTYKYVCFACLMFSNFAFLVLYLNYK